MMMPANYSVIAENEMTYINGGSIWDYLPSVMTSSNWKTFSTNVVKIIGNSSIINLLPKTLGVMFGGSWGDGETLFGEDGTISTLFTNTDVLNGAMTVIGALAGIYTMGTTAVDTVLAEEPLSIYGTAAI